ncbi:MAG: P-loop NTPase [Spirochaetota bacterium]
MRFLPVASGKGGVGKSLLAANLAIALSRMGRKTILVDLDMGGSNLHMILGLRNLRGGLGTFLSDKGTDFESIVVSTDYSGLRFVPGDAEIPGMANLQVTQKRSLIKHLRNLEADDVVLDLGAGTHLNTLDFFLVSNRGIIVTTPTPTATVNAYLFMKNLIFRLITTSTKAKSRARGYLDELKHNSTTLRSIYIPQLVAKIGEIDSEAHRAVTEALERLRPRIVLNMLEDPKDAEKALRLKRSCQQYLGLDLEHLGIIYRDELQDTALGAGLPIVVYKPDSLLSQAVFRIGDKILASPEEEADEGRWESVAASFEEAETEAEADFEAKMDYVEELMHTGALSTGDLVETIKQQQLEMKHLRRELALYKSKLVKAIKAGFQP